MQELALLKSYVGEIREIVCEALTLARVASRRQPSRSSRCVQYFPRSWARSRGTQRARAAVHAAGKLRGRLAAASLTSSLISSLRNIATLVEDGGEITRSSRRRRQVRRKGYRWRAVPNHARAAQRWAARRLAAPARRRHRGRLREQALHRRNQGSEPGGLAPERDRL